MADERVFTLIGQFDDRITSSLNGINDSIARLKRTMSTLTSKRGGGFSDVTHSVGKLISSQKHLAGSIREVGNAAKEATGELKEYNNRIGKIASAHYHLARSSQQAGDKLASSYNNAYASLEKLDRRQKLMATANRRRQRLVSNNVLIPSQRRRATTRTTPVTGMSGGGGGGGGRRGGDVGGSGGLGGYNFHMGAFAFGMQIGQGLSEPITAAVMSGFNMGVALMSKTLQYIQGSFAERVEDQMTDLQTAGGYLSISKRQKNPMFQSLQSAIIFTQQTNDVLERLAGELPGSTEEYVKVSKRIGDSVMRLIDSDEKGAIEFAKTLRETSDTTAYKDTTLVGPGARQGALQVILGELTKKTVMAGFGGSTGAGGMAGARGLPALMERLITDPSTSLSSLTRYAAVFGDPKIASALERTMPELEKAGSNMLERAKVINKMLDDVVPPEMQSAQKRTMAGVMEAFRSAFFSPGTGFLGFGRKLKDATGVMQPLTDVYGRFIQVSMKNGQIMEKVVDTAEEASQGAMDVFNMFSDILVNIAEVIKPIVDNLSLLWDPLQMLAEPLRKARIVTIELLQTFRNYTKGIDDIAKTISNEGLKEKFLATKSLRASLLTITNLFTEMGVLSEGDFKRLQGIIIDPKQGIEQLGNVLKSLVDTFFDSDAAKQVGVFVGKIVTSVLQALAGMTGFASGLGTSKLAEGFMEGFGAEGEKYLKKIFTDLYKMLFNAAAAILPKIPWWVYASAAATVLIPAAIAGAGMIIGQGMATLVGRFASFVSGKLLGCGPSFLGKMLPNVCGPGGGGGGGGKARPTPKTAKSAPAVMGGFNPSTKNTNARVGGASSVMMRPVGPMAPKGFERIALPGKAPDVTSAVTMPGRAPSVPAPVTPALAPKVAPLAKTLTKVKGKGVGLIASAMIAFATKAPALAKAGKSVMGLAKSIPVLGVAFTGLDFAMRKAEGQDTTKAAGGAVGAGVGGALGAGLGSLIPIPVVGTLVGGVLGSMIGGWIGENIAPFFASLPAKLSAAWEGLKVWLVNLPVTLGYAIGQAVANLEMTWENVSAWWQSLGPKFDKWLDSVVKGAQSFLSKAATWLSNPANWMSLGEAIINGVKGAISNIGNFFNNAGAWIQGLGKGFEAGYRETRGGYQGADTRGRAQGDVSQLYNWSSTAFGSPGKSFSSLAGAINFENKHKPPGSHLVIANSSETIIPAAKGYTPKPIDPVGVATKGYIPRNVKITSAANGYGSYGDTQVVNHINITQQPGQDSKELASLVAYEIVEAMKTVNDANILV